MANAQPVAGCRLTGSGPLRTVLADLPATARPADRLGAMVRCFSAGLDFLPLAAGQIITPRQARRMARQHSATLLAQLGKLAGRGQLSLVLSAPPATAPAVADGRSWLQARAQTRHNLIAAQQALDRIIAPLPYPQRHSEPRAGTFRCDLLVPRDAAAQLCKQISDGDIAGTNHLHLTVCGLWPAFHFADPPRKVPADA